MDDSLSGVRNKRGDWAPTAPREIAPLWAWPPQPLRVLAWLPGYVWPWNAFHLATALLWWFWVVPDVETLKTLSWGWPLGLLAVNWLACGLWYGAFEWRLYRRRAQGGRFKYHAKFPADAPSDVFWFKRQNLDNALRSFGISIPLWTLVQVIGLWCYANGIGSWLSWDEHPFYLVALLLLSPAIHELHFYVVHRLIHTPTLYKWIHSIHHNSVNPSPISSLSMHPVEAFLYHAVALWHVVIPSHPIVAMFQLHAAGFGAINGHIGFEQIELGGERALASHAYLHYLHHKHFEVNFGGDGLVPLDYWLGTWHDGSKACDAQMQARYARKVARLNAGKAG
jgi:sterol desaturase/sphingolipid hydroxylase (fatty acid hydroxylase superfamily)